MENLINELEVMDTDNTSGDNMGMIYITRRINHRMSSFRCQSWYCRTSYNLPSPYFPDVRIWPKGIAVKHLVSATQELTRSGVRRDAEDAFSQQFGTLKKAVDKLPKEDHSSHVRSQSKKEMG